MRVHSEGKQFLKFVRCKVRSFEKGFNFIKKVLNFMGLNDITINGIFSFGLTRNSIERKIRSALRIFEP